MVELNHSSNTTDLYTAKEWSALWYHKKIRENHNAFILLCLYLECANIFTQKVNLNDSFSYEMTDNQGFFTVFSNAIFALEKDATNLKLNISAHIITFLLKIIHELGIFFQFDCCIHCQKTLNESNISALNVTDGGFVCLNCDTQKMPLDVYLWNNLGSLLKRKYPECVDYLQDHSLDWKRIWRYLIIHTGQDDKLFKSFKMLK